MEPINNDMIKSNIPPHLLKEYTDYTYSWCLQLIQDRWDEKLSRDQIDKLNYLQFPWPYYGNPPRSHDRNTIDFQQLRNLLSQFEYFKSILEHMIENKEKYSPDYLEHIIRWNEYWSLMDTTILDIKKGINGNDHQEL